MSPKLTLMILTQPSRSEFLKRLLACLAPQVKDKPVEILVRMYDKRITLGENRQAMNEAATGEYICCIDDDDLVPSFYVERILPLLDGVDYIGFQVQCFIDGEPYSQTFHSLRYSGWGSNDQGYFRDISHANPIRRELALQSIMDGGAGEDQRWGDMLRELGVVRTEHYIDAVMYFYYLRTAKLDSMFKYKGPGFDVDLTWMLEDSVPISARTRIFQSAVTKYSWIARPCPSCASVCTVLFANGARCNQCGLQFQA